MRGKLLKMSGENLAARTRRLGFLDPDDDDLSEDL